MGLYDEKIENLSKIRKDKLYILIGLSIFIAIIIIVFLIIAIDWSKIESGLKGSNLSVKFSKNPFNVTKDTDLKINITIKNNSDFDSENASIAIYPVEQIFFVTCDSSETGNNKVTVPIFAKDASRTIECNLKISPTITEADILAGTYGFDVVYSLNSEEYEKRAILTLKK
jgi:hypothetical protein